MRHVGLFRILAVVIVASQLAASAVRAAEDAYYDVPFDHLTLTEGKIPKPPEDGSWRSWQIRSMHRPYAVLDGAGEAFAISSRQSYDSRLPRDHVVIRTPEARDVTGRLYVESADGLAMVEVKFKVKASEA